MQGFSILRCCTFLLAITSGVLLAAGCNQAPPPKQEKKAVPVVATTPIGDEITEYEDFTGRLDALKTVEIRARVSGFVMETPFKEGDVVHEGDLLFLIDPRTYQATFNQAEANLKQAEADLNLQQKQAGRAKELIGTNSIGQEEYDQIIAAGQKAAATLGSMQAARDNAKLYLQFTRVTAPLTGRISRRQVDPGNLVNADQTVLTTIVSDDPLYAYFDVDERTYLQLTNVPGAESVADLASLKLPVMMRLANEDQFVRSGVVDFVDNRVSATTGTIRFRGVFNNPNRLLKAGIFVRIRLPIGKPHPALLIPEEAVQNDQGRKFVFVVNQANEIVYRPVTLGMELGKLRVVKDGLQKEDRVVISGMQRVRAGALVDVQMQEPPKAPGDPLGRLLNQKRRTPPNKPSDSASTNKEKSK